VASLEGRLLSVGSAILIPSESVEVLVLKTWVWFAISFAAARRIARLSDTLGLFRSLQFLVAFLLFLAFQLHFVQPTSAQDTASDLLGRVRTATSSRPVSSLTSIAVSGKIDAFDFHGQYEQWGQITSRQFTQRMTGLGYASGSNGWDGRSSWAQNTAGIVQVDDGKRAREGAIDEAYLETYAYLRTDAGGAAIIALDRRTEGDDTYDRLQVTPQGGSPIDIWVDARTNLIDRASVTIGGFTATLSYSDYRRIDGLMVPFKRSGQLFTGIPGAITLDSVSVNDPLVANHVRQPASDRRNFTIAGASTIVPISLFDNHIFLDVLVNGKGPYTFVFDTGSRDNFITPEVAAATGAQVSGSAAVGGIGAQVESVQLTHINSIQIGKATMRDQDVFVLPIAQSFGVTEGIKIDGLLGYNLPAGFITTIDYYAGTMSLAKVAPGRLPGAFVPFTFDGAIPRVTVRVNCSASAALGDCVDTDAVIDTGNRYAFFLFSPFIAAHPRLAASETTPDGIGGWGFGGPVTTKLGRVDLGIGPFSFSGVVTQFSTAQAGVSADPLQPGNVGGGILSRFTVVLDYPERRLYLSPNANYPAPFSFDRSGLTIIFRHNAVEVVGARAGTPAADAGLRQGDVIIGIDDQAAPPLTLHEIRAILAGATGTRVKLRILRVGESRDLMITLRDYV